MVKVVAYRDPTQGGVIVAHRIVGQGGIHYILKGDNNTWLNPNRPTEKELLGKIWIAIAKIEKS